MRGQAPSYCVPAVLRLVCPYRVVPIGFSGNRFRFAKLTNPLCGCEFVGKSLPTSLSARESHQGHLYATCMPLTQVFFMHPIAYI